MSATVTFKFIDNLALTQKMPLAVADMAFDVNKVIEKHRPFHAQLYPLGRGGGKRRGGMS